jgi:hypothetical protein
LRRVWLGQGIDEGRNCVVIPKVFRSGRHALNHVASQSTANVSAPTT